MKKSLTILLTLALTVSISGCTAIQEIQNYFVNINVFGQPEDETAETSEKQSFWDTEPAETEKLKPTATPKPTPTPIELPEVCVVTNGFFPPFEFYEGDALVGIDIDLIEKLLGNDYKIDYSDVDYTVVFDKVAEDPNSICIAGMPEPEDQYDNLDYIPYYTNTLCFVVRDDSGLDTNDDVVSSDSVVGVVVGTTSDIYMTEDIGEERIVRYSSVNMAVIALYNGEVDAILTNIEDVYRIETDYSDFDVIDDPYSSEQYVIAVNKDADEIYDVINSNLDSMLEGGSMTQILAKYGLGSYSSPSDLIQNNGAYFCIDDSLLTYTKDEVVAKLFYFNQYLYSNEIIDDINGFLYFEPWDYSDTFDSYMDYYSMGYKYTIFLKDDYVAAIRYEETDRTLDDVVNFYQTVYGLPAHECMDANGNYYSEGSSGYGYVWALPNGYLSVFENPYDNEQHVAVQYQVNEYQ